MNDLIDGIKEVLKTCFRASYIPTAMSLIMLALVWGLEKGGPILGVTSMGLTAFALVYPVVKIKEDMNKRGPQGQGETFDDHQFPSATEQQSILDGIRKAQKNKVT